MGLGFYHRQHFPHPSLSLDTRDPFLLSCRNKASKAEKSSSEAFATYNQSREEEVF